jgi:hypothetical protein
MDVLWSLGLVVVLLIALNHMAGGKASGVIRPVTNIVSRLLSFCRPHRDWASGLSLQDRCWFDKIAKTQS